MGAILAIVAKEFRHIRRDKRMIPLILVSPIFQLVILGYAATLDVKEVRTVICDLDRTAASREVAAMLEAQGTFRTIALASDYSATEEAIRKGRAHVGIVIPVGFEKNLKSLKPSSVLLVVDGTQATIATIALNYARDTILRYLRRSFQEYLELQQASVKFSSAIAIPEVRLEPRVLYNEAMRSADFMVPAVLAMVLMVMTVVLSSMNLVREKETGTIEQLIVTPVRPIEIIVGKLLPFVVIGFIDIVIVLAVALFWFDVPFRGSGALLFLVSALFLMSTLGLGLVVSAVSATQQQAMMTAVFFVMVPSVLLSGFIFPIENMPGLFQEASRVIPMRYYLSSVRGIFLKGIGPDVLWQDIATLASLGLAILTTAATIFRKRI